MKTKLIRIYFDGGCSPNLGRKYGSHHVMIEGGWQFKADREQYGFGTNNEAEINSLQSALNKIDKGAAAGFWNSKEHKVVIEADSKIVRNRLLGKNKIHSKPAWKEASERMFKLANDALAILNKFADFDVVWKQRELNVQRFGH